MRWPTVLLIVWWVGDESDGSDSWPIGDGGEFNVCTGGTRSVGPEPNAARRAVHVCASTQLTLTGLLCVGEDCASSLYGSADVSWWGEDGASGGGDGTADEWSTGSSWSGDVSTASSVEVVAAARSTHAATSPLVAAPRLCLARPLLTACFRALFLCALHPRPHSCTDLWRRGLSRG